MAKNPRILTNRPLPEKRGVEGWGALVEQQGARSAPWFPQPLCEMKGENEGLSQRFGAGSFVVVFPPRRLDPLPPNVVKKGIGRGPCTHRLFCSRCVTSSPRYKDFSLGFSKKLKGFPKGTYQLTCNSVFEICSPFQWKVWAEVNIFELYYVYVISRRILIEPCRLSTYTYTYLPTHPYLEGGGDPWPTQVNRLRRFEGSLCKGRHVRGVQEFFPWRDDWRASVGWLKQFSPIFWV